MALLDGAHEVLGQVASALALAFEATAVLVIAGAALRGVWVAVREARVGGQPLRRGRLSFVHGLILGLDLFVAADLLDTVVTPGLEELAVVGLVVVIRTVLAVALEFEIRQEERG